MDQVCTRCGLSLYSEANFCSRCGKKLKAAPPSMSISEQIKVYLVCVLVPPFGLWYSYKYLKCGGKKEKIIGYVTIILTVITMILLIEMTQSFMKTMNMMTQSLKELSF